MGIKVLLFFCSDLLLLDTFKLPISVFSGERVLFHSLLRCAPFHRPNRSPVLLILQHLAVR